MEEKNAVIIALFIFQYALTIPLMAKVSSSIIIGLISSSLLIASLFINRRIKTAVLICTIIIAGLFVLKTVIDLFASPDLLIHYCIFVLPSAIMMMYRFDTEKMLNTCYKLAILNFFILLPNPFLSSYSYMRFGYGMILTTIFSFICIPKLDGFAKLFAVVVMITSLGETFLYGARGCIVVFILFFSIYMFLIRREKIVRNVTLIGLLTIVYIKLDYFIELAYLLSLRIGIGSYSIAKYRMQMSGGLAYASSGRDLLFHNSIELIKQHPFLGNTIESIGEDDYVHDLFLQVAQDFGIPIMIVLVILLIMIVLTTADKKYGYNERLLLCCLFSISVGRLLFSSTLYKRPEFWLMIALYVSIICQEKPYKYDNMVFSNHMWGNNIY